MKILAFAAIVLSGATASANIGYFNCYQNCFFMKGDVGHETTVPVKSFDFTASLTTSGLTIQGTSLEPANRILMHYPRRGNKLYSDNGYPIGTVGANGSFAVEITPVLSCTLLLTKTPNTNETLGKLDCHNDKYAWFKGDLILVDHTK